LGVFKMGFLKKLFNKEEKEEKKPELPHYVPSPLAKDKWVCFLCQGTIDCGERWSKFQGNYYHKQCFKNMKRGIHSGEL